MQEIYLVDCENVGTPTIIGKGDYKIYYFINNKNYIFGGNPLYYEIIQCNHNGCKDAMDFIIDFYLGRLTTQYGTNCVYYIVSNDKGYENVINSGRELGYNIRRKEFFDNCLFNGPDSAEQLVKKMTDKTRKKLSNICKDHKKNNKFKKEAFAKNVMDCLSKYGYNESEILKIIDYMIVSCKLE